MHVSTNTTVHTILSILSTYGEYVLGHLVQDNMKTDEMHLDIRLYVGKSVAVMHQIIFVC